MSEPEGPVQAGPGPPEGSACPARSACSWGPLRAGARPASAPSSRALGSPCPWVGWAWPGALVPEAEWGVGALSCLLLGQGLWVRGVGSRGGHPSLQAHVGPWRAPPPLQPFWVPPAGPQAQHAGCGVPTAGSRSRAGHDLGARSKSLVPGGGTRLPLPGPLRPGHEAQCSQGLPPCCGALVSPRLPSRRAVPTQGPRGQSASPPLSRAPSCARAAGSRQAAPRSAVTVVSVLASPASTTSGGPQAVLRPRTEPCPLPTVPEVLQLSDALRDDILPELGVRLEDHEGGSSGCGEGLLGGGCQVGLAFGRTAGTGPRAPRLLQGPRGRIVPLGHHASPPLS